MPRYFIELSYCGTPFQGWQIQSNTSNTIQHYLSDVLSCTLKHPVLPIGCGRTDSGVHAKQFFAHFDSHTLHQHPFEDWIYKWNRMLPKDIAIHRILPVIDSAHARYSALSRTYEYHIHQKKNPFLYHQSWYYPRSLNHQPILQALSILKQHTNFACFTKDSDSYTHTLCNIYNAEWLVHNDQILFRISANRFLRNMIRALVGTLIALGTGKYSLNDFETILLSADRKKAGFSAPPHGLYLTQIVYPDHLFIL